MLNIPAGGGSAGGMLDRSRMALCAFTFLFLSLNPLASLLCSSGSSSADIAAAASTHHAGRSVLGLDIAGIKWLHSPVFMCILEHSTGLVQKRAIVQIGRWKHICCLVWDVMNIELVNCLHSWRSLGFPIMCSNMAGINDNRCVKQ